MSNARLKRKQKSREKELAKLADEPMADQVMEMISDDEAQEIGSVRAQLVSSPTVDLTEDEGKELATKPHMMLETGMPFGGAQSWRQMEEFRSAQASAAGARQTSDEFEGMIKNILADDSTGAPEKAARFSALAAGFAPRVDVNTDENKEKDPGTIEVIKSKIFAAIGKIKGPSDEQRSELRERLAKVNSTGFQVFKDVHGNSRWFGWVSNKWRDRDVMAHPQGEIISEEAHKEFVEWAWQDKDARMPQLWIWHTPGTQAEKRADWLDYADGFLLASGSLTEKEATMFDRLASKYDLAMSHGFFKIGYDTENGIISKYRGFEDSVLPREHVANEWTDFATLQEAKDMGFTDERREVLVEALGEEKVVELEASTKESSDVLKDLGVEFKEAETPEKETAEAEPEVKVETEEPVAEAEVEPAKALDVAAVAEALGIPQLDEAFKSIQVDLKDQGEVLQALAEAVVDLRKSDDEKVAETLTPRVDKAIYEPSWIKRLSQSEETEIPEEKEKETKENEGAAWAGDVHGLSPDPGAQVPIS